MFEGLKNAFLGSFPVGMFLEAFSPDSPPKHIFPSIIPEGVESFLRATPPLEVGDRPITKIPCALGGEKLLMEPMPFAAEKLVPPKEARPIINGMPSPAGSIGNTIESGRFSCKK
jgi:hypothetical protein